MTEELKDRLQKLADKYEISSFTDADPSQFLRWYPSEQTADVETTSFIAAMLAFGNRRQFIPKIREILEIADNWYKQQEKNQKKGGISDWCMAGAPDFPYGSKKFYRFYSYDDMHNLFKELALILEKSGTLGQYFKTVQENNPQSSDYSTMISEAFPESSIVPKGKNSANKRIHMFLRWMIRQNSPVDLGIWTWAHQSELLIPLDVHVMQEGIKLGLLSENAKASHKTAVLLTEQLKLVFPGDPCRGDFSLFGLGVDS